MDIPEPSFAIVGVGASAGGIEALSSFFRAMPNDPGAAFIIVMHLNPERESLLVDIVRTYTGLTVEPAVDDTPITPDHVYVLPENAVVAVEGGRLRVRRQDPLQRERKPIDLLLSTLAKDQGPRAAAVILSGGDGDGTLGVKAIKACGGLALAQVRDGTRLAHPDMPLSAIATGLVDLAIPADEMAAHLVEFARGLRISDDELTGEHEADRRTIYDRLQSQTGHDFTGYKVKSFERRVRRRMHALQIGTMQDYGERLRQDATEVAALFRDLLISVTSFFRDVDAFEALRTLVIPRLFEGRSGTDTVRIWVPGCATGEEVYSLAILLREYMDGLASMPHVQIFATDIQDSALSVARAGRYPEVLLEGLSPERRERFFVPDGYSHVVSKELRDLCIFSLHSIVRAPPFSRMDLLSGRNLLIYLSAETQAQIIPVFHYSLRPSGYLFLGASENTTQFAELFTPIDKAHRIFRARPDAAPRVRIPFLTNSTYPSNRSDDGAGRRPGPVMRTRRAVETHVLDHHAPAHLVVTTDGNVVYFSARTGKYLEAAPGAPSQQLLAMARRGLRLELRSAFRRAIETNQTVTRQNIPVETDEARIQLVSITVEPLPQGRDEEPLFLVLFADSGPTRSRDEAALRPQIAQDDAVLQVERELRDTREQLQSMVEEYETALEELKSSNEELVSVNEELQSANEELEASKEELQSLNEELQTVNLELSQKVDALDRANTDLNNLYESTQIATIFLDRDLAIRNFTPPASVLFNVRETDRGRRITDFSSRLDYPDLADEVAELLRSGEPSERNVSGEDGRANYLTRLRPYRRSDGKIDGVIATFVDVTALTASEARQKVLVAELNHRVKNMLAVVLGIVRQTVRSADSLEAARDALVARLESMARSFELLSLESWTEAGVDEIVRQQVEPFGPGRVEISGATIRLKPKQALSLGMIVHELATNAARHGALANESGRVDVHWTIGEGGQPRRFILTWQESGGVAPEKPEATGFGLVLVERETAYGLDGEARMSWEPTGLRAELEFNVS